MVGYRAHSQVHGDLVGLIAAEDVANTPLNALQQQGVTITTLSDGSVKVQVPTNVAFFNPDLVENIGLGSFMRGMTIGPQYSNDEQIDNQLRSLLFQIPNPNYDPSALDGPAAIAEFSGVVDLGAIDIERGT